MELRRPTLLLAVAVVGGAILAGCGGSDEPSGTVVQPISVGTSEEEFVPPGASNTAEASIASSIEAGTESSAESGATSGAESGATSGAESGATSGAESGATSAAESGGGESSAAAPTGDAAAGKTVFMSAGCVGCHTLADAGASGTVGPNLDDVKPPYDVVIQFVTNGSGPMPAFGGQLSEADIQNVAAYVSSVAGQ